MLKLFMILLYLYSILVIFNEYMAVEDIVSPKK